MKAITKSDTSDEATRRFEDSMEKLRRLEVSKGYIALLKEADELRYSRRTPMSRQIWSLRCATEKTL